MTQNEPHDVVSGHRLANILRAVGTIDPKTLEFEPGFFRTKWFDYRFLTPAEATELFADQYRELFRSFWRMHFDLREAHLKEGIAEKHIFSGDRRSLAGIWVARQCADGLGVPYEYFIRYGLEHLMSGRSRRIPRPNQLFDEQACNYVDKKWQEAIASRRFLSDDPRYLTVNFRGDPTQCDYRQWLLRLIKLRSRVGRRDAIQAFCFEKGVLPREMAVDGFGEELVGEAEKESVATAPQSPSAEIDLRPGCFATPNAYRSDNRHCMACPFYQECGEAIPIVNSELRRVFGTTEPIKERKRRQNAERQRRFRARRRPGPSDLVNSVLSALRTGGNPNE